MPYLPFEINSNRGNFGHIRWDNGNDDFWGNCFWDSRWPETSIIPDGMIESIRSLAASSSRMLHTIASAAEAFQQAGFTFVDDSDD